ncbi:MAG: 1,4-alpha-glucan branching protein GlgB [Burkholderiales bacterium]|nr:1,4-alpha-glucan branching protein GlgB [Burkholderiales bacterium]
MLNPADIGALAGAAHPDPFAVLGMHEHEGRLWVRAVMPHAQSVEVLDAATGRAVARLAEVHPGGVFDGPVPRRKHRFDYRLRVTWDGVARTLDDPYRFPVVLGELDVWLLSEGRHARLYEKLGAHAATLEGVAGISFALWAPNARRVSVVGDFNYWDGRRHPLRLRRECGVWEIFIPELAPGARYKFELQAADGSLLPLKADPFAFAAELRPATASVVHVPPAAQTASARPGAAIGAQTGSVPGPAAAADRPITVYEMHAGSWRRGEGGRWLSWGEIGDRLLPYIQQLGFTHVELLPVMEHPFDGSWGYQPLGLYAPTARHGTPDEFAALVKRLHEAGIGVFLDWVPGHFPDDAHGLAHFDGTPLYEHADPRQGFHQDWKTLIYNFGRHEVRNFLCANALFWIERYGVDGLRVDAVASMLYLDYSRAPGDWIPNKHGGRENLEAVRFIRDTNHLLASEHAHAVTIAEESTAWGGVSRPVQEGGLGFNFKWNMGWMHDTLQYMQHDPVHRRHHHDELTFGPVYAFSENFVLPLSHDEVVHGKGSLLAKMPGDRWQQFANLRLLYGYMWAFPGKKLLFMGGEFGQGGEWNHDAELDWGALGDPHHLGVQRLVADLNRVYRGVPALHQCDCDAHGFEWIDFADREQSVIAFMRRGRNNRDLVIALCNFTPVPRHGYRIGVPQPGAYREVINTDAAFYGGSDVGNAGGLAAIAAPCHGRAWSVAATLPPLACVLLEWVPD